MVCTAVAPSKLEGMTIWPIWLAAGLLLLALEVHHQAFFAVFAAAACFAATVVDLAGGSLWVQSLVFAGVGFGGVGAVRPIVVRKFQHSDQQLKLPGVYGGFVGQHALALDEIGDQHHPGHVQLAGQSWLAITDSGAPLAAHTPLVVAGVRGSTLVVRGEV
jgi:membrane protein implicated in regulation of membrane protease activity